MSTLFKSTSLACVGLAMSLVATTAPAEARRSGYVAGAIVGGVVAGALIAGASRSYARERVYVTTPSGCGEYRRRAIYNEEIGRHRTAAYNWDKYHACRGD